ncbi:uncharacterized protein PHACADRAFT_174307 [Phanerochaete carnosa HHB-10118-sp]|uniref:Shugoshin C-terminal domain-containing protein n=1 Tax=Phanerochaete carnosa (strain HHB-10118-sp) TaxID=650164 RepID=K5X040_PHACS|nr:uncharacterized protein PHACADRAFT_174307 [Phanerochaete carnosa HHB-10118-sp]EKM56137.1 hypothetical protein PHACADRAFT_174307 [Phanerochaete carnosa HHB-10118-sp]
MSRRPSRVSVDTRQNDTLLEFETFKKKFLLANKHITKLNSTLSVRIEELNAQISTLYVENLRLRASEIALAAQLKKEREKSRKILEDAETATHALMKQLGYIRKLHRISRESSSPEPEPAPRARRPLIDTNASPPPNRLARAPTVPALYEEDEDDEDDIQTSPTPRRRKSKSRTSNPGMSSSSRLPLPTRTSSPPPDRSPFIDFDEQLNRVGKKRPTRRQSGLLTASMSITTATPSGFETAHLTRRPPSPAFGSPLRRDAAMEEGKDQALAAMGAAMPDDDEDETEEPIAAGIAKRKRKSKDNAEDMLEPRMPEHERRRSRYKEEEDEDDEDKKEQDKRRSRDKVEGAAPSSYGSKKPKLKDVTNAPPPRSLLTTVDTHDREQYMPIDDPPPPSSATSSSSHSARTFLATPATKPQSQSHLPTPRASSPVLSSEPEHSTGGRERRVRKSVNYAEPKLNTKMRKPDPPPLPPGSLRRSSSMGEHIPRRSLEKSASADSLVSRHAASEGAGAVAGVKRKKSRPHVPTGEDDESDGTQADGEYGVRASSGTAAWVAEGRRRSVVPSSSVRHAEGDEGRRHSMAV